MPVGLLCPIVHHSYTHAKEISLNVMFITRKVLISKCVHLIGKYVHLLLLCALSRFISEVAMAETLHPGKLVERELYSKIPVPKSIFPQFKTCSCPANFSLVVTKSYASHGASPSLACLRCHINYQPLLSPYSSWAKTCILGRGELKTRHRNETE